MSNSQVLYVVNCIAIYVSSLAVNIEKVGYNWR